MEEKHTGNERRYGELETLPVAVVEIDLQGSITFINNNGADILGYKLEELQGLPFFKLIAPEEVNRCVTTAHNVMAGIYLGDNEFTVLKKDGTRMPTFIQSAPIKNEQGDTIGLRGVVIKKNRESSNEASIWASEEKYRTLVNNIKLGVVRSTPGIKGKFLEVNLAMEDLTGYSRDELLSMDVIDLYLKRDERQELQNEIKKTGETVCREVYLKKKDGNIRLILLTVTPVKDPLGVVLYMDGILEDFTERKRMEERIVDLYEQEKKQREALQEESKTRAMFIDVLAHELRTPLTPIMASINMLKEIDDTQVDLRRKLIDNVQNSTQMLLKRLEDLLDLARYARGAFKLNIKLTEMNRFMKDVIVRFKPSLKQRKQELIEEIPESLPNMELDPSRIEQVMINLLSNASKYSHDRETIRLKARVDETYLQIDVSDNGLGIDLESQKRLFVPYQRVERGPKQSPGLGLGLAVSKQIIEAHGGKIWVVSQPGAGSTFSFQIPLKGFKSQNI